MLGRALLLHGSRFSYRRQLLTLKLESLQFDPRLKGCLNRRFV